MNVDRFTAEHRMPQNILRVLFRVQFVYTFHRSFFVFHEFTAPPVFTSIHRHNTIFIRILIHSINVIFMIFERRIRKNRMETTVRCARWDAPLFPRSPCISHFWNSAFIKIKCQPQKKENEYLFAWNKRIKFIGLRARKTIQHFLQLHSRTLFRQAPHSMQFEYTFLYEVKLFARFSVRILIPTGMKWKTERIRICFRTALRKKLRKKKTTISMRTNSDPIR